MNLTNKINISLRYHCTKVRWPLCQHRKTCRELRRHWYQWNKLYDWFYLGKFQSNYVRSSTSHESSTILIVLSESAGELSSDLDLGKNSATSILRATLVPLFYVRLVSATRWHAKSTNVTAKRNKSRTTCCFLAMFSRFAVLSDAFSRSRIKPDVSMVTSTKQWKITIWKILAFWEFHR